MLHQASKLMLLTVWLVASSINATAGELEFGQYQIQRGERLDFSLPVLAGDDDPATHIPMTVLAGERDGPTVLVIAGVHGFEFAPILAAERLAREISLSELSGNLVIVRVAHVPAFENRSPYVNPFDRKNLNRSFPGSATGTQTDRIAHVLSTLIIPTADFVFDVHSGDGAEWLDAFVGVYGGPLSSDYETALSVALSMRFPNVVRYSMKTQEQIDTRRSLNRQAVAQGVPTVLVEVGENGRRDDAFIERIVSGLRQAFAVLKLLPGKPLPAAEAPRLFDGTQSVVVEHSGLWHPSHRVGRHIEKDELLGVIKGYTGEVLQTVTAPVAGYTIYGLAGPPVKRGDSVVTIAIPVSKL